MKVEQKHWTEENGWKKISDGSLEGPPQLVLVFGGTKQVKDEKNYKEISKMYPDSDILMCSTAGEIIGTTVSDDSLVLTAIYFDKTKLAIEQVEIKDATESHECGEKLAKALKNDGLIHVMIFSDGMKVNGTPLVKGLLGALPEDVSVTGGLVGDGSRFKNTYVGLNRPAVEGKIVVIGFYGDALKVGYGSLGGWDPFGPSRTITKSDNNVLFELDDQPALKLYKEYLGDQADGLPGTGLLFPLMITLEGENGDEAEVVRTILGVDEEKQSMTFAGDMPKGTKAQLMKANFERLVDGASGAASMSIEGDSEPDLAILISCVGRKLVLAERIEEEVEAVQEVLGKQVPLIGFYSYGEISPVASSEKRCRLHNQTMTITTFKEM